MENEYKYPTNGYQCYLQKISKKNGCFCGQGADHTRTCLQCPDILAEGLQMPHLEPFQNPPSVCNNCNFKKSTSLASERTSECDQAQSRDLQPSAVSVPNQKHRQTRVSFPSVRIQWATINSQAVLAPLLFICRVASDVVVRRPKQTEVSLFQP